MTLVNSLADRLSRTTDRRGFLQRVTMWGAAIVAAPSVFILTPSTAYAAICGCANQSCDCNSKCCGGYTEFCCTIYGENACPPGGIIGGWWKVEDSSFCGGGARYYMDCHSPCEDCGCSSNGICSGSCNGTECTCANADCRNRKAGCVHFRYGNCNNDEVCIGPIICRVVTCTLPWELDAGCSTASRIDNNTRYHDAPCLHDGADPLGFVEEINTTPGNINIEGWVLDVDATGPTTVHVYVDGTFAGGFKASIVRRDVQNVFGTTTDVLGFNIDVNASGGSRRVCVYAINVGGGTNKLISCTNINVPSGSPVGNLETIEVSESGIHVRGWAFDRSEGAGPVTVRVLADSTPIAYFSADRRRSDVQNHFGLDDDRTGFDEIVPAQDGNVTYCVEVLDQGDDGSNIDLGCRSFALDRDPRGWLDGVDVVEGGVRVTGWAVDPDSSDPVGIHVYADSTFLGGGKADEFRPDVGRALGVGDYHGFDLLLGLPAGTRTIKVFAINLGPGRNSLVGMEDL